jgi:hypothetical protein
VPQVTLVAHARVLLSGWKPHVRRSSEAVRSRAVGHVLSVNGARGAGVARAISGSGPDTGEPERRALGVTTHRPGVPGMDHTAAQPAHPLQRERHVGDGEIRQRCRVSRPAAARVDTDSGPRAAGLMPGALPLDALLEAAVEQLFPEAARPLGLISGELDQGQLRAGHRVKATA